MAGFAAEADDVTQQPRPITRDEEPPDHQALLLLLDAISEATSSVDAHRTIALACCVCVRWGETIAEWRSSVRELLLIGVPRRALRVVARQYTGLQRLEIRSLLSTGYPKEVLQCPFSGGSHADMVAACRELLTGCPLLVHVNLQGVSMKLTRAERGSLLTEFLLEDDGRARTPSREIEAGARVTVDFDGIPFPGVVQGRRRSSGKRKVHFTVHFEDGSRLKDITRGEMTRIPWPGAGVARSGLELLSEKPRPPPWSTWSNWSLSTAFSGFATSCCFSLSTCPK